MVGSHANKPEYRQRQYPEIVLDQRQMKSYHSDGHGASQMQW